MFTAATVVVVIAAIYLHIGGPAARAIWFPLAYGLFLVPPPGYAVEVVTMPIMTAISKVATWLLSGMGYSIVRSGVSIYISQFHLLVEDAWLGLQSLLRLLALGLFYGCLLSK